MNLPMTRDTTAGRRNNIDTMPCRLRKRIGSTVFTVNIHFSSASDETVEDKIIRLVAREVVKSA